MGGKVLSERVYINGAFIRVELVDDSVDPIRVVIKAEGRRARGTSMRPDEALTLARLLLDALDTVTTGMEIKK